MASAIKKFLRLLQIALGDAGASIMSANLGSNGHMTAVVPGGCFVTRRLLSHFTFVCSFCRQSSPRLSLCCQCPFCVMPCPRPESANGVWLLRHPIFHGLYGVSARGRDGLREHDRQDSPLRLQGKRGFSQQEHWRCFSAGLGSARESECFPRMLPHS